MSPTRTDDTIVEEITIKAPAHRIFEALTNPEECMTWWGREGRFGWTRMECDLRPGGRRVMRGAGGGKPGSVTGVYRQVERPRLLVFTWLPDWRGDNTESVVRWDLEENGGVTTVRLTHSGLTTEASRSSHRGWPSILGRPRAHAERTV